MSDIVEFKGEHRWLSNFSDAKVSYDGVEYPTVEHAYQASKPLTRTSGGTFASSQPRCWPRNAVARSR